MSGLDVATARLVPVPGVGGWLARVAHAVLFSADSSDEELGELLDACEGGSSSAEVLGRVVALLSGAPTGPRPPFALVTTSGANVVVLVNGDQSVVLEDAAGDLTNFSAGAGAWLTRSVSGAVRVSVGFGEADPHGPTDLRAGVIPAAGGVLFDTTPATAHEATGGSPGEVEAEPEMAALAAIAPMAAAGAEIVGGAEPAGFDAEPSPTDTAPPEADAAPPEADVEPPAEAEVEPAPEAEEFAPVAGSEPEAGEGDGAAGFGGAPVADDEPDSVESVPDAPGSRAAAAAALVAGSGVAAASGAALGSGAAMAAGPPEVALFDAEQDAPPGPAAHGMGPADLEPLPLGGDEPPSGAVGGPVSAPDDGGSPTQLSDEEHASAGAVATGESPDSGPIVGGRFCAQHHFNAPREQFCRICGLPLNPDTTPEVGAPRPLLGVLVWDSGDSDPVAGDLIIGRDPAGDPEVSSGQVGGLTPSGHSEGMSRVHAELRLVGWDVTLADRGSTNGTFVWEEEHQAWHRLESGERAPVKVGSIIAFGERTATFELPGGGA